MTELLSFDEVKNFSRFPSTEVESWVTELSVPNFIVRVPFKLNSKSNFRYGQKWSTHKDFSRNIAHLVTVARPSVWTLPPSSSPTESVSARHHIVCSLWFSTIFDSGNVSKSILDALEGVLYFNDAEVRSVYSATRRSRAENFGYMAFAQCEPDVTSKELLRVQHRLDEEIHRFVEEESGAI